VAELITQRVTTQNINEKKIGHRGSKLNKICLKKSKEQTVVVAILFLFNFMQLRCALMGFERNYQVKNLSKQLKLNKFFYFSSKF